MHRVVAYRRLILSARMTLDDAGKDSGFSFSCLHKFTKPRHCVCAPRLIVDRVQPGSFSPATMFMGIVLVLALTQANLLYAYPVGDELLVSSHIDDPGTTADDDQQLPDVAMAANGNAVVVFQHDVPGDNITVAARLYNALGTPTGPQFRVNTTGPNDSTVPTVAMDNSGNFVIAWADNFADGSSDGIMVRRYNAAGVAQGPNVAINTTTQGRQYLPDIAMNADGNFVIVWQDNRSANLKRRVLGRYFNADGSARTGELEISANLDIDHTQPRVAIDAAGNFVVCWQSGVVGRNQDLAVRRYNANGIAQGPSELINGSTRVDNASQIHSQSSVAMDAKGNYVVVWRADNFSGAGVPGSAIGILGRRFSAEGSAIGGFGGLFVVSTAHAPQLNMPEIAMSPGGDFIVAYEAQDPSSVGIWIQRYYASAQAKGPPFLLNSFVTLVQSRPSIAVDAKSNAMASWESGQQDAAGDGVYAQRLAGTAVQPSMDFNHDFHADILWYNRSNALNAIWQMNGAAIKESQFVFSAGDPMWQPVAVGDLDNDGNADLVWRHKQSGLNAAWLMNGFAIKAAALLTTIADPNWRVAGLGDFNRDGNADILWRHELGGHLVIWQMQGVKIIGGMLLGAPGAQWTVAAVDDFDGDGISDIVLQHTTGWIALWLMDNFAIREGGFIKQLSDANWQIVGSGDFNHDGSADMVWRHAGRGENMIWLMDGLTLSNSQPIQGLADGNWKVQGVRDFDRDAGADILWRHAVTGDNRLWIMDGANVLSSQVVPAIADSNWIIAP